MKYLIYLSTSVCHLSEQELIKLLKTARERNKKHDVTGVLLYSGGTFVQVLEGTPEDVDYIFNLIERDLRHRNIIKLVEELTEERNFSEWSMGFSSASPEITRTLAGYITSIKHVVVNDKNNSALNILRTFIATNNLVVTG